MASGGGAASAAPATGPQEEEVQALEATSSEHEDVQAMVKNLIKKVKMPSAGTYSKGFPRSGAEALNTTSNRVIKYEGVLSDIDLLSLPAGVVWPSGPMVRSAAEYWYSPARVESTPIGALLPTLTASSTAAHVKGQWVMFGIDHVRVFGFLYVWAGFEDTQKGELSAKMRSAAEAVSIHLSARSDDDISDFFHQWQLGEDALKKGEEAGNCVSSTRMLKFAQIEALLKAMGAPPHK